MKHPPLPPKQCCFAEKYLCGLKTTLIRGEEGGKDDFQKNQSIKPYKGESVPTLLSEIVGLVVSRLFAPFWENVTPHNLERLGAFPMNGLCFILPVCHGEIL